MNYVFNHTNVKNRRKLLRRNFPPAEQLLWFKLKNRSLLGYKFRRQYSVNWYIVDFYCPNKRLAIEIDGDSHFQYDSTEKDKLRQSRIEKYNIIFLRFTNIEIYNNLSGVLEKIVNKLNSL